MPNIHYILYNIPYLLYILHIDLLEGPVRPWLERAVPAGLPAERVSEGRQSQHTR